MMVTATAPTREQLEERWDRAYRDGPDGDWSPAAEALWEAMRPFVAALTREDRDSDVVCERLDEASFSGAVKDFLIGPMLREAVPA